MTNTPAGALHDKEKSFGLVISLNPESSRIALCSLTSFSFFIFPSPLPSYPPSSISRTRSSLTSPLVHSYLTLTQSYPECQASRSYLKASAMESSSV